MVLALRALAVRSGGGATMAAGPSTAPHPARAESESRPVSASLSACQCPTVMMPVTSLPVAGCRRLLGGTAITVPVASRAHPRATCELGPLPVSQPQSRWQPEAPCCSGCQWARGAQGPAVAGLRPPAGRGGLGLSSYAPGGDPGPNARPASAPSAPHREWRLGPSPRRRRRGIVIMAEPRTSSGMDANS
jgi:hypothetical protein